ncbi:MAG: zinc-dependent peptidase [Deltaproteobacteria bacterium]|nr:zinc-dependent peptidase [Deltaproteobacteria bacterium]
MCWAWWRARRRRKVLAAPLDPQWQRWLTDDVAFFARMPAEQQRQLLDLVRILVAETRFVAAAGFELSERHRVVIAAAMARLALGLGPDVYRDLRSVVVYPDAWKNTALGEGAILGEAHDFGVVVLSWKDVAGGLRNDADGHDTATHEFAHVLDGLDGRFDGVPPLASRPELAEFAGLVRHHLGRLRRDRKPERRVLRSYGATNEAEFFAVATEAFFEKPRQLQKRLPELYAELVELYRVDPAAWTQSERDRTLAAPMED